MLLQVFARFAVLKPEPGTDKTDDIRAMCAATGRVALVPTRLQIDAQRGVVVIVEWAAGPAKAVAVLMQIWEQIVKNQSTKNVSYSAETRYTSGMLLKAVDQAITKAQVSE